MENHAVDFENGYKIRTVYAPRTEEGGYGDIYNFPEEVMLEYPGKEILTGYCVISEETGLVPDGCNDWNESVEDAIQDYEDHVLPDLSQESKEEVDKKSKLSFWSPESLLGRLKLTVLCVECSSLLAATLKHSIPLKNKYVWF